MCHTLPKHQRLETENDFSESKIDVCDAECQCNPNMSICLILANISVGLICIFWNKCKTKFTYNLLMYTLTFVHHKEK